MHCWSDCGVTILSSELNVSVDQLNFVIAYQELQFKWIDGNLNVALNVTDSLMIYYTKAWKITHGQKWATGAIN